MRALLTPALALTLLAGPAGFASARGSDTDTVGGVPVSGDPALVSALPGVSMPAGVLWTADGRSLWERDADEPRAMASTTKIMTALVVLEAADLEDTVTVSARAASVGEAGINLVAGQQMRVGELLEAVVIRSGNDAAFALAEHVSGTVEAFVQRMNDKAAELGLDETAFANPHGLDAPGHHTSAADLATLSTVAMADPRFAAMVTQREVRVREANGTVKRYESSNKLLDTYSGATGIKTGWTNKAGYCVVASAERDEIALIAVVMGATSEDDRFVQARALLDWGFEHYTIQAVSSAEETAALVTVSDYLDRTVAARVAETVEVPVFDFDGTVTSRVDVLMEVEAPVVRGQRLGTLSVVQGDRLLAQIPLVAGDEVPAPDLWESLGIWFTRLWRTLFGGEIIAQPVLVM
jgi:D-alanyl-D-alanine carboxypeptidase (penicillin-binding protein 5/6)